MTDELRAKALAATPGPWGYRPQDLDDWGVVRAGADAEGRALLICQARQPSLSAYQLSGHRRAGTDPYEADAAFIAAANPQTVLALLDRLQAAEAEKATLTAELAEARAENARLREVCIAGCARSIELQAIRETRAALGETDDGR